MNLYVAPHCVDDFKDILETIRAKVNSPRFSQGDTKTILEQAYLFCDLMEDTLRGKYDALSLDAWLHVWAALLYFLEENDIKDDSLPIGLFDDLQVFSHVRKKFRHEFDQYSKFHRINRGAASH